MSHTALTPETQRQAGEIAARLDRPIVLVGLMGAGKTRFGRALAKTLGLKFHDSDAEIEKAAGMSIAEIFEKFGEPYFRDGERRVMERLLGRKGARVISTGGGAIMDPAVAALVWGGTVSIWLRAEIPVLAARVRGNRKRPLLAAGEAEDILAKLAAARDPVYGKADIVIDSGGGTPDETAARAIGLLHGHVCTGGAAGRAGGNG
jgi:shikimate kinase